METEAELADLRGSKYVTSDMSRIFKPMEQYVAEERIVIMSSDERAFMVEKFGPRLKRLVGRA